MRKILGVWLLFCLLIPAFALAETEVHPSADKIVIGEWISVSVTEGEGKTFVYSMYKGEKQLFEGLPTTEDEGWYLPESTGEYTLHVAATDENGAVTEMDAAFEVCELPVCSIICDTEQIALGESVQITAEVTGGTGDFTYDCAVIIGNACVNRVITKENVFFITPDRVGDVCLLLTVTDKGGHACTAEYALQVTEGKGIQITGDTGAFHAAGGLRIWQVNAPGIWRAKTETDFVTLHRACGTDGDELVISLNENNTGSARQGVVTVYCEDASYEITVHQTNTFPMEAEAYMDRVTDAIFVDGDTLSAWHSAEGEKAFRVEASGEWKAACEADFVTLRQSGGELTAVLDENTSGSVREATVVFTCGRAQAVLHISQMPQVHGADVKSVRLSRTEGVAYREQITAYVITSADAEKLTVSSAMWQEAMIHEKSSAVPYRDNELVWQIELPLRGQGDVQILFEADGIAGTGDKAIASLKVTEEEADFKGGEAKVNVTQDGLVIDVTVTHSADEIVLQDAMGSTQQIYTTENAFVDYAPDGDSLGRYARWTLKVPEDVTPAYLTMGEYAVGVNVPEDEQEEGFVLYSQQDTLWDDVRYRHSNLETSGCAIFALSHVLQLLDFEGEEILPENLADEYAFCLVDGGTLNSTLIGNAGDDLGYKTRYDLYENLPEIREKTKQGAMWSFMVAKGHIAAVVGMSEDGKMFRIIDSAPSATFERTEKGTMYLQNADGTYTPIMDLSDVPGSRYYLESSGYNGMEYWMTAEYVAKQGVRLIMPVKE